MSWWLPFARHIAMSSEYAFVHLLASEGNRCETPCCPDERAIGEKSSHIDRLANGGREIRSRKCLRSSSRLTGWEAP